MVKKGLGKGLGALIEQNALDIQGSESEIDINRIDVCVTQPRKNFNNEKLSELADSIKSYGIIQPLVLKPENGRFTIIAGERRYRAARLAGLKTVPAIVKDVDSRQLLELSIIENIQREDLNPIEEAQAIEMLLREYQLTQEQLSERIGKSRSALANSMRLLSLPEIALQYVVTGELSAGHARALLALKEKELIEAAAEYVIAKGLSVRETEEYVKKLLTPPRPAQVKPVKSPEYADAEEQMSRSLSTKVNISGNDRRGRIVIDYFSKEQLDALYDFLVSADL